MEEKSVLKGKIRDGVIVYGLIFLAVIVTPLLAAQLAKIFDFAVLEWWKHGQLRVFYTEVITALLWVAEIVGFHFLIKSLRKKKAVAKTAEMQAEDTPALEEAALANAEQAEKLQKPQRPKKEKTPLLPLTNMIALFALCAACVLLLSAQIGFQVKVFYDLGERVVLSEIIDFGGITAKNIVKCIWIVLLIKASLSVSESLMAFSTMHENAKKWAAWIIAGAMLLVFGLYDVIVSDNKFMWTYLVFYAAFTAIYFLTNRAPVKSYLLIFFLYLF